MDFLSLFLKAAKFLGIGKFVEAPGSIEATDVQILSKIPGRSPKTIWAGSPRPIHGAAIQWHMSSDWGDFWA